MHDAGEDIQAAYAMAYNALEPAVASRLENEEPLPEESHVCSFDANSLALLFLFSKNTGKRKQYQL